MSELDNVELKPETPSATAGHGPGRGGGHKGGTGLRIAAVLVVLVLGVVIYLFFFRAPEEPQPAPVPVVEREAPEPAPLPEPDSTEEKIELPPLGASDAVIRELVGRLSRHPRLLAWLAEEELVRKFVASVDNIAEGVSPRPHLAAAAPRRPFPTREREGEIYLDPNGYSRYDTMTTVFTSLDPAGSARLYRQLQPLFQEAYRELGYPSGDFGVTLQRAIARLLETPRVEGEIRLLPKVLSYEYADARLEALAPAQRNLLRMGPENVGSVQAHLRRLARALEIPEEKLPRTPVWRAEG